MSGHSLLVEDLTVSYRRIPALHLVGFQISCGCCVAVLGPNGAGKSTLLKALAGLLPLETGSVHFHGRPMHGANQEFAYLPQREMVDWDFPTTVRGVVEMGRYLNVRWWKRFSKEDERAVDEALDVVQLRPLQARQISALSGGQQQRVFIARALAQQAHVLLLDEPFTGLDQPSQDALKQVIKGLRDQGKLVLISHHDLQSVPGLFDRVILLNGELIASGTVEEAFTNENLTRTFGTRVFSGLDNGMAV